MSRRASKTPGRGAEDREGLTEELYFGEANCVTITDGERTAIYVPLGIVKRPEEEDGEQGMGPGGIR
jgi:hypothetical protein